MRSVRGRAAGPRGIEEYDSALDLGRGYGLVLDGRELATQLGDPLLEPAGPLLELSQALGGHVAPAGLAADGGRHVPRSW